VDLTVCKVIEEFMTEENLSLIGIIKSSIHPGTHDNDRAVKINSRNDNPVAQSFKDFCKTIEEDDKRRPL
jgi:hypothetical protein